MFFNLENELEFLSRKCPGNYIICRLKECDEINLKRLQKTSSQLTSIKTNVLKTATRNTMRC